ncbi:MAG TPA: hypothetical protein HPP77_03005 [Candidatus Hydrogenedentes bacterium]|nr:hypothetical protein [Candidatus Hydrogenedentota bacterium]
MYDEKFPDMVELVKAGVENGQFEVTSMTHSEDIISWLPRDEMAREIAGNLNALETTFGVRPKGAYNPEQSWDPFSGKLMLDAGIEWVAISNWQLSEMSYPKIENARDLYTPAYVRTVEDGTIKAVFNSLEPGYWGVSKEFGHGPGVFIWEYLNGSRDSDHIPNALERLQAANADGDMLLLFCQDSEDFWRSPYYGLTTLSQQDMEERFDRLLSLLESLPYIEFVTISEYLERVSPGKTYYVRPSVALFDRDGFGIWERGAFNQAYNLNIQCNRAGEDIRHAELLARIARKKGKDTRRVDSLLEESWQHLGLAKTASGRGYGNTEPFTMWCSDHANTAMKRAREALDEAIDLL